jgi:hypothetical protein
VSGRATPPRWKGRGSRGRREGGVRCSHALVGLVTCFRPRRTAMVRFNEGLGPTHIYNITFLGPTHTMLILPNSELMRPTSVPSRLATEPGAAASEARSDTACR